MNLDIDNEKVKWLSALIYTKDNSVELYNYQISELSKMAKNIYLTYLKKELSENNIDKILKKFYQENFDNIILIDESFVNLKVLSEVETYNANLKFLDVKFEELKKIVELVNKDSGLKPHVHSIKQSDAAWCF